MGKQLLREYYALCDGGVCQDLLSEQEKRDMASGKKFYMTGCMQKFDTPNGNGRVYSQKILQREVENYWKLVKERRALGELDHPDDSVINLKNASHLVTDMWWDGPALMGKVEVLDTPSGNILKQLANSGVTLGISSRGLGSVKRVTRTKLLLRTTFSLSVFFFVFFCVCFFGFFGGGFGEEREGFGVNKGEEFFVGVEDFRECEKFVG